MNATSICPGGNGMHVYIMLYVHKLATSIYIHLLHCTIVRVAYNCAHGLCVHVMYICTTQLLKL